MTGEPNIYLSMMARRWLIGLMEAERQRLLDICNGTPVNAVTEDEIADASNHAAYWDALIKKFQAAGL